MTTVNDNWIRRCLIVPSSYVTLARALCEGLTPGSSGYGMLATATSATGVPPPTYFIAQGMIKEEFASLLPFTSFDLEGNPTTTAGQPKVIVQLSQGAVTLAQVNDLLATIDVTDQDPFVAMQRLGLKMIQEDV